MKLARFWILAAATAAVAFGSAVRGGAQSAAPAPASGPVNPELFKGVYYKPLTVFSRGGRVTAVAGVASNPQLYYMGAAGGGVWKTEDAGTTWVPLTDGQITAGSIGAIAVAESNPNILYVGTGSADPRSNVSNGDGVYKSTDAGKTWQHVGLPKAGLIGRIRIHPTNPDLAYVAAVGNIFGPNVERGVYRTKDGGKTWEQVLKISENTGAIDLSMDPKSPGTIFAAMWTVRRSPWSIDSGSLQDGLYRTTNGGDTWTKLAGGLPGGAPLAPILVGKIGVSISPVNPRRIYALIEAEKDQGGVYRSDDGGETWARTSGTRNLLQRAFYYTKIYADPVEPDTVYGLNVNTFKSTDGGKTWGASGINAPHGDNHDLWINPTNNKTMIESNDGGASVSVNGGPWSTEGNQPTAEIYRLEVDTRWPYYIYGAQQDSGTIALPSTNVGETYGVGGGESGYIAVDPRNANLIYAGNYGGTIDRTDRLLGISESVRVYADMETGQRAADMKYRFQWNAPIRLSPHNPDVVYVTSQYVHRSTDGGQTWEKISGDLTRNLRGQQDYSGGKGITRDNTGPEVHNDIFAFEESPVTAGLLWAGSDDGLLHLSRDNGKTWQNITPRNMPEGTINAIDLSPKNAGHAIISLYRYTLNDFTPFAYETNDYGATWKRVADGTTGIPAGHFIRVVREDPDRPGLLFAGTEYGMYISYDDGAHWQALQLNLPVTPIMDLKIYRHNLIVATQGRAFWLLEDLPAIEQLRPGMDAQAAVFYKPADAHRQGGILPTFYYWFKEQPTAPVNVEVSDAAGKVVYTVTAQPGTGGMTAPSPVPPATAGAAGGGRGGRGGGGGGGAGGGRGGFVAFGGGGAATASAVAGANKVIWTSPRLPAPYQVPPRIVMWGGGGAQGPKPAPGIYTVKVSSGTWSQTQTFHLGPDPRYQPSMTDAEGGAQLKMALEVGGWIKQLYDNLAKLRDAKQQAADISGKAGAQNAAVAGAAKAFTDKLADVEGELTQLEGEASQDALNFPGRFDNQLIALYSNIVSLERKLNTAVTERYTDVRPQFDMLMERAGTVLKADVEAFNAVASKAGAATIIVK